MSKKKIKEKQSSKSSRHLPKNSRLSSKNSRLSSSKNPIQNSENSKSLQKNHKSMPVIPPPNSIELIDPAIVFTPEQNKHNSITLVCIFEIQFFV